MFQEALNKSSKVRRTCWPPEKYIEASDSNAARFYWSNGKEVVLTRERLFADDWEPYVPEPPVDADGLLTEIPTEPGLYFMIHPCLRHTLYPHLIYDSSGRAQSKSNIAIVEVNSSKQVRFPGIEWWMDIDRLDNLDPTMFRWRKIPLPDISQ